MSSESTLDSGPRLVLRPVGYDHPDAVALTVRVQAYYVELYGGPDGSAMAAADFDPPYGRFFVGYLVDRPVAMGGWRFRAGAHPDAARPAELKRMYVDAAVRRQGLARRLLRTLETDAAASGADWLVLESGAPQAAAIDLYRSAGYLPIPDFGLYAGRPGVVNLGKPL